MNSRRRCLHRCCLLLLVTPAIAMAAHDGNRLTYLDAECDPYYVGLHFPRLITPQWVGETGVDLVITLGIDDMRESSTYEQFLRPILNRLKEIDGRAPVSIMTNSIAPEDPQLQRWLGEGLSLETHTADHPCPCLRRGDFAQSKQTYDQCVDQLARIPGSRPVAFRFPCMDSMNTPSPRAFAEIFNRTTPSGNFLQISSSICVVLTSDDPQLPRDIVYVAPEVQRFARYLPFANFVNRVKDYPYPFVIGKLGWEFPCAVPDDWQGQHLHGNRHPQTAADYQAFIDGAIIKQGTANFVFHPSDWLGNELLTRVIDHADRAYGRRIRFLNFRECAERLQKHLLLGESLRDEQGRDNGVRLLDINNDGYLDVVIGNSRMQRTRIWIAASQSWRDIPFPAQIVRGDGKNLPYDAGVRFGILRPDGMASFLVRNEHQQGLWHFDGHQWLEDQAGLNGLEHNAPIFTARNGIDQGVRLRDLDGDGGCELIVGNATTQLIYTWSQLRGGWQQRVNARLPSAIVNSDGHDVGLRFVDLNFDRRHDIVVSNEVAYGVYLFTTLDSGFSEVAREGKRTDSDSPPPIAVHGENFGAWFADGHMWAQNEFTDGLPDGVMKYPFSQLLGTKNVGPLSPEASIGALRLPPGYVVQLVAAEPLVRDPVAMEWDAEGRLWVVEMADYPLGLDDKGQAGGRVRFLEDLDGDAIYDRSTLFLDGLNFPSGVIPWGRGVLVSAAPEIFYAEDSDGDGRADRKEVLYSGFGEGNQQHRLNGFCRGLDNWLYLANGHSGGDIRSAKNETTVNLRGHDLRIEPQSGKLELISGETQHGRYRDDWGNWFGGANHTFGWQYVLPAEQLSRNRRARYPSTRWDLTSESHVFPASKLVMHWEGYQPPGPGQHHQVSSACSYTIYGDDLLGSTFQDNWFLADPTNNLVHRRTLVPDGLTFTSRRVSGEANQEFLASVDPWFRPVCIRTGPDGALWIADMYRMVIEHPEWIGDAQEKELFLRAGFDRGRIYRIYPVGTSPRPMRRFDRSQPESLVAALASRNRWERDNAQQCLIGLPEQACTPDVLAKLKVMAENTDAPLGRLHALCTLDGLNALDRYVLQSALHDRHPGVRRHAVRLAASQIPALAELADCVTDMHVESDPHVVMEIAFAAAALPDSSAGQLLGNLLLRWHHEPLIRAAITSSLNGDRLRSAVVSFPPDLAESETLWETVAEIGVELDDATAIEHVIARRFAGDNPTYSPAQLRLFAILLSGSSSPAEGPSEVERLLDGKFSHKIVAALQQARQTVRDDQQELSQRLAAVALLVRRPDHEPEDIDTLQEFLVPQAAPELQQAAITALGRSTAPATADLLLERWAQLSPPLRQVAAQALLERTTWTEKLIQAMQQQVVGLQDIEIRHRQRLLSHERPEIRTQAETLWQNRARSARADIVAQYEAALPAGDEARGTLVFARRCASCHQLDGIGHSIGADLGALMNKSVATLLEAILDPNRAMESRFMDYTAQLTDGRVLTGMLADEDAANVSLRGFDGQIQVIRRTQLEQLRSTGRSYMPEGLENDLSVQDMADVIAFVQAKRVPPKSFAGNSPRLARQADAGRVKLTASDCRIYGPSLIYETGFQNLGSWSSEQDVANWSLEIGQANSFDVILEYACHPETAGNTIWIKFASQQLEFTVASTGSWETYQQTRIGQIDLSAGLHELTVRAAPLVRPFVIDLRAIELVPITSP